MEPWCQYRPVDVSKLFVSLSSSPSHPTAPFPFGHCFFKYILLILPLHLWLITAKKMSKKEEDSKAKYALLMNPMLFSLRWWNISFLQEISKVTTIDSHKWCIYGIIGYDCSYFVPLLYRLSIYCLSTCNLGLNMKQRQRNDTDGLCCKLHLLSLEPLNITHNSWNTEINAFGEKPWRKLWRKTLQYLKYIIWHYTWISLCFLLILIIYPLNQIITLKYSTRYFY